MIRRIRFVKFIIALLSSSRDGIYYHLYYYYKYLEITINMKKRDNSWIWLILCLGGLIVGSIAATYNAYEVDHKIEALEAKASYDHIYNYEVQEGLRKAYHISNEEMADIRLEAHKIAVSSVQDTTLLE